MGQFKFKCGNCGNTITVDEENAKGLCPYCSASYKVSPGKTTTTTTSSSTSKVTINGQEVDMNGNLFGVDFEELKNGDFSSLNNVFKMAGINSNINNKTKSKASTIKTEDTGYKTRTFTINPEDASAIAEEFKPFKYEIESKRLNADGTMKLKLKRPTAGENEAKITKLENEYDSIKNSLIDINNIPRKRNGDLIRGMFASLFISACFIAGAILARDNISALTIFGAFGLIGVFIALFLLLVYLSQCQDDKTHKQKLMAQNEEDLARLDEILEEAKKL